eukprot:4585442-Amphidinium_carterae.1
MGRRKTGVLRRPTSPYLLRGRPSAAGGRPERRAEGTPLHPGRGGGTRHPEGGSGDGCRSLPEGHDQILQQSIDGFKKRYPEVRSPTNEDYEYYSFLWDKQLVYPEVWEVPVWFRRSTLLASAEEEKHLRPLVEGGRTYLVRKKRVQDESDEGDLPPTSPASVPGGAELAAEVEDTPMQETTQKEENSQNSRMDA